MSSKRGPHSHSPWSGAASGISGLTVTASKLLLGAWRLQGACTACGLALVSTQQPEHGGLSLVLLPSQGNRGTLS